MPFYKIDFAQPKSKIMPFYKIDFAQPKSNGTLKKKTGFGWTPKTSNLLLSIGRTALYLSLW
jgi:hypothetical protein